MVTHGKGPRLVLVKTYGRWQRGHFRRVKTFIRGLGRKLSLRSSTRQLCFGFDDQAPWGLMCR
jgi:hypothetical protein